MVEFEEQQDVTALLSDFNVRLQDVEEKQELLRQRVLLIGNNIIKIRENTEEELRKIKAKLLELEEIIKDIRHAVSQLLEQADEFARKSELEILRKQAKIFQPLEFVKKSEVEEIIDKIVEKKLKEKLLKTVKD